MKVAITGSQGFLGSNLAKALVKSGHNVMGLCRSPKQDALGQLEEFQLNLNSAFHDLESLPEKPDYLVHAAYNVHNPREDYHINVEGARQVFKWCETNAVNLIFISSCSAHAKAESYYGKSKWLLEQELDKTKHCIIRPGFIIGDGGVYKRLKESIRKMKFAPLFWGGEQPIQLISIDNVVKSIQVSIEKPLKGAFHIVNHEILNIKSFYTLIFHALDLTPKLINLPGGLTLHTLKLCEKLGLKLPMHSENLLGLKQLQAFSSDCKQFDITDDSVKL